uniref:Uncharacterized protein n=1 Tax=Anguilla anguilla TaxID=7936 RepID=A0A0E9P9H5_ANGAN
MINRFFLFRNRDLLVATVMVVFSPVFRCYSQLCLSCSSSENAWLVAQKVETGSLTSA